MKKSALINTGTTGAQKGAKKGLVTSGLNAVKGINKSSLISSGVGRPSKKIKKV